MIELILLMAATVIDPLPIEPFNPPKSNWVWDIETQKLQLCFNVDDGIISCTTVPNRYKVIDTGSDGKI